MSNEVDKERRGELNKSELRQTETSETQLFLSDPDRNEVAVDEGLTSAFYGTKRLEGENKKSMVYVSTNRRNNVFIYTRKQSRVTKHRPCLQERES